ncbi:dethiobiotin synthase [Natronomonas sp. EA1]|uniref:dethiobiotin synthase n=1 Tax=Natronomonas sp. EA1 TaxID=3421655 RepID=UPI003EB8876C
MTEDFAVVGTGTGVGKTVVTAGLVGTLRDAGVDARAVKPCQTGYPPDDDAGFVAEVCGTAAAATCLRRLEPPLAPEVAADEAGRALSYEAILTDCERALADAACGVLEGVGGLRVPLAEGRDVIDLVADLGLPAVVVARSGLGTLNHSALTVEALRRRDIPVRGVVLNEYEAATVAERTNPAVLARMVDLPVETLPPLDLTDPTAVVTETADNLSRSLLDTVG